MKLDTINRALCNDGRSVGPQKREQLERRRLTLYFDRCWAPIAPQDLMSLTGRQRSDVDQCKRHYRKALPQMIEELPMADDQQASS